MKSGRLLRLTYVIVPGVRQLTTMKLRDVSVCNVAKHLTLSSSRFLEESEMMNCDLMRFLLDTFHALLRPSVNLFSAPGTSFA